MWGIIATWKMAEEGVKEAGKLLGLKHTAIDSAECCVKNVEANPNYISVGLGGLPNANGQVEVDASVMDGVTLSFGAVAAMKDILHPCSVAKTLIHEPFNNFLVGEGANHYAKEQGFESVSLLTENSKIKWQMHHEAVKNGLRPYIGHDTVCAVALDQMSSVGTVTSTSGLFYKRPGRIGDSPIPGSGYYADSLIGGAAATGLGEDIAKGVLSYEIVRLMGTGLSPQKACEKAVTSLHDTLIKKRGKAGDISVIAIDHQGRYGAATNIESFPFIVMTEVDGFMSLEASFDNNTHEIKKIETA